MVGTAQKLTETVCLRMLLKPQGLSSAYEGQNGRVQRFLMPLSMPLFSSCPKKHPRQHGRQGSLKTGHRQRLVPLPKILVEQLKALLEQSKWTGPDDPVFAGGKGKPVWADNLAKREVKPIAQALGMPWLSWHVLRHTCATLTKSVGMMDIDRRVLMGHAERDMTDHYTHEDWERMRAGVELVAAEVTKAPKKDEPAAPESNVIVMRKAG